MFFKKPYDYFFSITVLLTIIVAGCNKKDQPAVSSNEKGKSTFAGEEYADKTEADTAFASDKPFESKEIPDQARPNMIYIEGGRCVLGFHKDEFTHQRTHKVTATVPSFFMDQTEVANIHWLEYLHYLKQESTSKYRQALPDTTVWQRDFSFNDYFVENYLRHPAFQFYPVVGVNWLQATDYCRWRTKVVRENFDQSEKEKGDEAPQETDSLAVADSASEETGQEESDEWDFGFEDFEEGEKSEKENAKAMQEDKQSSDKPEFRLPTEAEWIYAAQGFIGKPYLQEKGLYRRVYPWDGTSMRNPWTKDVGYFFANFKRGHGDYGGTASKPNDGAVYTEYIYAYPPNDFGLYNMAGNVNEWVKDVYHNIPFGKEYELNPEKRDQNEETSQDKERAKHEYIKDKYKKYLKEKRYRVYKGGSWDDYAYWLSPSTRRRLLEDSATSTIGFRCAMSAFPGDN